MGRGTKTFVHRWKPGDHNTYLPTEHYRYHNFYIIETEFT